MYSSLLQIHCTDNDTLTAINTFLEHFPPPPTVPFNLLSPPGSEEKLLELEAKSLPPVTNGQILEVKFDLPTLYPKSHVAVFTFSTFSEGVLIIHSTNKNCINGWMDGLRD